jgi:hypothetical protein
MGAADRTIVAAAARSAAAARGAKSNGGFERTPKGDAKMVDPAKNPQPETGPGNVSPIAKPSAFSLDKFRSKRPANEGGVETLIEALPHYPIPQAKDYVRLHPDETAYWSNEMCFVRVPIPGTKKDTLHLIVEDIALANLPSGQIQRFRLALATKPHDIFFLAHIPTTETDNSWNLSNLRGCEQAKTRWVQLFSRKAEGVEQYKITYARDVDAFPEPNWPKQPLNELILASFSPDRIIDREDHPGLLRLMGAKPPLK